MSSIILDPGHGLGNKRTGVFDPGAVADGVREADIALDWANEIRGILRAKRFAVVRTRVSNSDPCSISARAKVAKDYKGKVMLSLHCNASDGKASGTETYYRGEANKALAKRINDAVVAALGTKNRGPKIEADSQHAKLAVMAFQPCFLLEIGFIDNAADRTRMLDPVLRKKACEAIAEILAEFAI